VDANVSSVRNKKGITVMDEEFVPMTATEVEKRVKRMGIELHRHIVAVFEPIIKRAIEEMEKEKEVNKSHETREI
jgi:hypothetical protein